VPAPRPYSDEEVEAAVQALAEPGRLDEAQRLVSGSAPQLQRILSEALEDSDWFGATHVAEVRKACGVEDPGQREAAVATLIAEETRVSMLIGVAVGLELAHLLDNPVED
jgi:hypothetical protein